MYGCPSLTYFELFLIAQYNQLYDLQTLFYKCIFIRMKLETSMPDGCVAVPIAFISPTTESVIREAGTLSVICGDRRMDFVTPYTSPIKYPRQFSVDKEKLVELAADALCGFCVECPNNRNNIEPTSL